MGGDAKGRDSFSVRVDPLGVTLEISHDESVMHAAERQGYRWPTLCHGQARCTVCVIDVSDDPDAFDPASPLEREGLKLFEGRSFYVDKVPRLACQARPVTDTVVTKRGVRRAG
jgi:2Fe-2S ferredoxin